MTLYVRASEGHIYHIVLERNHTLTLCGLRLAKLKSILLEKPKNGELCKHCVRLQKANGELGPQ